MEKDKSYTAGELANIAEAWAEEKKTRSIVILAIERGDNADPVKVSHLISGSARNLVVALAGFINENPVIFKPAIKLAEIIEAEEKKKKGS